MLSYSNSSTPAPTYTENTIPGPYDCNGNSSPCYLTYTAAISVAPDESLYINETFVNGTTYNYSATEYWGTGDVPKLTIKAPSATDMRPQTR